MVDVESLLNTEHISDVVKVHPKYVASNIYDIVLHKLQEKYENKSTEYGFIRKGSIKLHNVISAQVEYHTLHGYINVNANFTASVFRPLKDAVVWTKIIDANNFGYKASSFIDGESVLEIIIPKNMFNVRPVTVNVNDIVKVKLLDIKIDHVSHRLSAIAYIVQEQESDIVAPPPDIGGDEGNEIEVDHGVDDDTFFIEESSESGNESESEILLDDDENEQHEEESDGDDAEDEMDVDDDDIELEDDEDDASSVDESYR